MKRKLAILGALLTTHLAFGQGTFVYDQRTANPLLDAATGNWFAPWPVQSFTPSLNGIGFVELLGDHVSPTTQLAVNLRANSPDGTILGTTSTLTIPRGTNYTGLLSFLFPAEIPRVPGDVYYMEPFVVKPSSWGIGFWIFCASVNYPGGRLYFPGDPLRLGGDIWFREGIVVPEPGTMALVLLGASCFMWRYRRC